jgi:heme-degrading monooxygenase HmoA
MSARLSEMDATVTFLSQLDDDSGPIVLINKFNVDQHEVEALLAAWADDASWMKQQPGYISTQLHRGTAGSATFINIAIWESARALGQAFRSPEFQERVGHYPDSTTTSPHVFRKVAVAGICVD